MAALAHHPMIDAYDLSCVELIASGGAPLGADLQHAVAARFPHAAVGQAWRMTETAVGVTMPDRKFGTVPGSVGRVQPNTELRVVDTQSGRDLGPGERGELWGRGPQVMAGYLNRPDATAEIIDADGWLHTGDLGYVDGDGNVFIVDRLKELIKVNAYQVAPAELEALLSTLRSQTPPSSLARTRSTVRSRSRWWFLARRGGRSRRPHGLDVRARRAPQADPLGAVRRRHPQDPVGEGPAPDPRRTGPTDGVTYCRTRALIGMIERSPRRNAGKEGPKTLPLFREAARATRKTTTLSNRTTLERRLSTSPSAGGVADSVGRFA